MTTHHHISRPHDRLTIIDWAAGIAADPSAVFLDTETTGVGPHAEIVDIAVIGCGGEVLLDTFVRPRSSIPHDASRIHGIVDDDVAGAPQWEEVLPSVTDAIAGRRVVVYNANFDRGMIESCCRACSLKMPSARWDCAMEAYAAFIGERSTQWRGGYRRFRLEQAVRTFDIMPGGHRALADAEACRLLVLAMAEQDY